MRTLLSRDKRALSNVVAYVLLISIALSLSVIVYSWLRSYASDPGVEECPDNINLVVQSYECSLGSGINFTLKNKGLFTVDGYLLRVHDRPGANFGAYVLEEEGSAVSPGQEVSKFYSWGTYEGHLLTSVTVVEVQPIYTNEDGEDVICRSISVQSIECS